MGTLTPGYLFADRFEIEHLAGSGGMGNVYRARDRESGALVALKLLHPDGGSSQDGGRFVREAQLLSALRHPGIVSYVAHGRTALGHLFLAMEWLQGEDLGQRLARGRMSPPDAVSLMKAVTEALGVAHRQGICHRDLKPSNLFLPAGDIARVKILDFGIARQKAQALTRTGTVIGTPGYMAPEQARGVPEVTPAADVFSLGCVLYECLTGKPPFAADHIAAVLVRILFEDPAPLAEHQLVVSESLVALLAKMLQKNPTGRFQDAAELNLALRALGELPVSTGPPIPARREPRPTLFADSEQGLLSVILASLPEDEGTDHAAPQSTDLTLDKDARQRLLDDLAALGGSVEFLVSGALLVTMPQHGSAQDQVARAARAALLLKQRWTGAVVALATGRGPISGRVSLGEVVARAARNLRRTPKSKPAPAAPSGVFADELSARLLQGRFVQLAHPEGALLLGEDREVDASRPLLGKPTPFVGRERELTLLEHQLTTCIEESEAQAVLLTAEPGLGKTRLRHEFQRRAAKREPPLTVLFGGGDSTTAGAPYWAPKRPQR